MSLWVIVTHGRLEVFTILSGGTPPQDPPKSTRREYDNGIKMFSKLSLDPNATLSQISEFSDKSKWVYKNCKGENNNTNK